MNGQRRADRPPADRRAAPPGGVSGVGWAGRRAGIGDALGRVALGLAICFGLLAGGAGYWQVIRASDLSRAPDDAAVIAASRTTLRGAITDRDGNALATSQRDANGETYRAYASPALSGVLGYASVRWFQAHPIFRMDIFEIRPVMNAGVFASPMLLVLSATVLASLIPAWRAARTDPAPVLRERAS